MAIHYDPFIAAARHARFQLHHETGYHLVLAFYARGELLDVLGVHVPLFRYPGLRFIPHTTTHDDTTERAGDEPMTPVEKMFRQRWTLNCIGA